MPKEHRITSAGNSAAVTLSSDELGHLHRTRGDCVIITKAKGNRLIIKPGSKMARVRSPTVYNTKR